MLKNKVTTFLLIGGMGLTGLVAGVATIASAQSASTAVAPLTTTVVAPTTTVDTPEPGDTPDAPGAVEPKTHGHAPLGGDGVVTSISGTTVVVGEESDEGGASYTVDASKATITNNGVAGSLTDVKVGEKIFVEGVTTGTDVTATSISIGHRGEHADKGNDTDGTGANEAAEPVGSSDAAGE